MQVDAGDVGYIRVGDAVHVKLDTYPFQRHGTLAASVRNVSEDAFRREAGARGSSDAFYLARLALSATVLKNMPENARLLPRHDDQRRDRGSASVR